MRKLKRNEDFIRKTVTAQFQGKSIKVTHLTPVLSPEERTMRKLDIEHQLYDVFVKYNQPNSHTSQHAG